MFKHKNGLMLNHKAGVNWEAQAIFAQLPFLVSDFSLAALHEPFHRRV